jgi:ribosomal protein L37E
MSKRYTIGNEGKSITCHRCGMTSWSAGDVSHHYCGNCNVFHDEVQRFEDFVRSVEPGRVTQITPGIFVLTGKPTDD